MKTHHTITIDGPAGSGKSTLGALLAQHLGWLYFDTGVMYRAVALAALHRALDGTDATAMTHVASHITINVVPPTVQDTRHYTVLLDGNDVTWAIRGADVERLVSCVAHHAGVRSELIRQQRIIGHRGNVVMVGRDSGTVVMPHAPLKFYLHASLHERARRRHHDLVAQGATTITLAQVEADLARRDALDAHAIQPAHDAIMLSTDNRSPAECVAWMVAHWQQHTP